MRGNLGRQTAQCCGKSIRQGDDGQQGSRDFPPRMPGTRDETFNEQSDDEQECQDHAADPPGNRRPKKAQWGVRQKLKKEHTGCGEDGAGKKEAGAKNQGDAILGSLKTNESHCREDESKKAADDLEIALEERIRINGDATQPVGGSDDKEEAGGMREENCRATAAMLERCLGHNPFFPSGTLSPGRAPTQLDCLAGWGVAAES